jgi:hypothetical protein
MKWILANGKAVTHYDYKYIIDWNKPAPSKGATRVKEFLRLYWKTHMVYEEYRVPRTRLRLDFLNTTRKIAIEFNGVQHNQFVEFFHKNKLQYFKSFQRDLTKIHFLERNGFSVIELQDEDLDYLSPKFFEDKFGVTII